MVQVLKIRISLNIRKVCDCRFLIADFRFLQQKRTSASLSMTKKVNSKFQFLNPKFQKEQSDF